MKEKTKEKDCSGTGEYSNLHDWDITYEGSRSCSGYPCYEDVWLKKCKKCGFSIKESNSTYYDNK